MLTTYPTITSFEVFGNSAGKYTEEQAFWNTIYHLFENQCGERQAERRTTRTGIILCGQRLIVLLFDVYMYPKIIFQQEYGNAAKIKLEHIQAVFLIENC